MTLRLEAIRDTALDARVAAYVEQVDALLKNSFDGVIEAHRIADTYDREHPGHRYWRDVAHRRNEEAHAARGRLMRPVADIYAHRSFSYRVVPA